MRHLLQQIKWAYQRVVRGYDERVMWQMDSYFAQIIPALQDFCVDKLQDRRYIELNEERCKIYSTTLDLIDQYQNPTNSIEVQERAFAELAAHWGKNIGWFWD